jgi:hypothetical protein
LLQSISDLINVGCHHSFLLFLLVLRLHSIRIGFRSNLGSALVSQKFTAVGYEKPSTGQTALEGGVPCWELT